MARKALTLTVTIPVPEPRGLIARVLDGPRVLWSLLLTWQARAAERAHLRALDARLRRDMGLSWEDVELEARKPFWQA